MCPPPPLAPRGLQLRNTRRGGGGAAGQALSSGWPGGPRRRTGPLVAPSGGTPPWSRCLPAPEALVWVRETARLGPACGGGASLVSACPSPTWGLGGRRAAGLKQACLCWPGLPAPQSRLRAAAGPPPRAGCPAGLWAAGPCGHCWAQGATQSIACLSLRPRPPPLRRGCRFLARSLVLSLGRARRGRGL